MNRITKLGISAAVITLAGVTVASADAGSTSPASDYNALPSTRVLDTRSTAPVGAGKTLVVPLTGVPADATAATVNLTVVSPSANGYVLAYADGASRPATGSTVNFRIGQTVANQVTVPVTDGKIDVYNAVGTANVVVDLEGYYTASTPAYTPPQTVTQSFAGVASVPTGGSFNSRATEVGTVDLKAGSYLVTLSAKETPIVQGNTSVQVFPSIHLYDQAKNADFTGDVLDTGGSALESGTVTNADLFSSNSGVVTLASDTTLYVYGFGYDSDSGEGTYQLDSVTVTATPVDVSSNS